MPLKTFPQANKKLGQHFLKDSGIINKISAIVPPTTEAIVEVGPGPGVLTRVLSQHPFPFYVIEKDKRFQETLKEILKEEHIVEGDALKIPWQEFLEQKNLDQKRIWLVSNLPYNIGVPLFIQFLQCPSFHFLTLMFQREVAQKILGFKEGITGKIEMGSLASLANNYFEVSLHCQVPPECFVPRPKVNSTVLSFTRRHNPVVPLQEFKDFEKYLRTLFQFKRKILTKGLLTVYDKEKIAEALQLCHISPQLRADLLPLEKVHQLYEVLSAPVEIRKGIKGI